MRRVSIGVSQPSWLILDLRAGEAGGIGNHPGSQPGERLPLGVNHPGLPGPGQPSTRTGRAHMRTVSMVPTDQKAGGSSPLERATGRPGQRLGPKCVRRTLTA